MQSVIWNINPFDQWGVELGKQMAATLLEPLTGDSEDSQFDSSTRGLLQHILKRQRAES